MEKIIIKKDQIINNAKTVTGKDLIDFIIQNLPMEIKLVVFKQESGYSNKIPAQINTYSGHKLVGIYNSESLKYTAISIEEEDLHEIMPHQNERQWK